ncbi:ABC transporter ATP-binding protein [Evansella sp. AB-P1]|uniref:ATP-binding cassette domain-containing protein n=1 Tax=Evansella sp. AB-P1 TaxID=3037653 RepID=UPI00241E1B37|nr:ABC transporter ATP-binding protein [Evansella sp. AB-P1]MDG5788046.1 ABC transporter ATP-binding protein [Evansella sp. AB-P1]
MPYKVEFNNVSLKYKEFEALKNISLSLDGGKIYGLLGRNGAGKTTLLSLMAAFREVSEGSIRIDGEDPFENERLMKSVALLTDSDYEDETEKVKPILEMAERYRPHFDMEYALHLVNRFKLPLDKEVNELSRGMKSALSVTIGLASRTPVTIFDETYLGMDAPTREIFYKELMEDQEENPRTIILSTHLVSEMDYLFQEVMIINKGELVVHEDYESLVTKGASVTGDAELVDAFTAGMTKLNEQKLGNTKAVMVYEQLDEREMNDAMQKGLEIGPVSLQDLFIHLTGEEE